MKSLSDVLASIGEPINHREYADVSLEGLPKEYSSVISVVK